MQKDHSSGRKVSNLLSDDNETLPSSPRDGRAFPRDEEDAEGKLPT